MKTTVLMPVYNGERHLREAVESVLEQTHADFDFIIINDGSKDGSLAILEAYAQQDARITVISQANQGIGESLNKGLEKAQTEWVFIMHCDDVMLPKRLERQLLFIQDNPDVRATSCAAQFIGTSGRIFGRTTSEVTSREKFQWHLDNNEAIGLFHPGTCMHRDTVLKVGGYRQPFWPAEDIDLWNRLAEQGHLVLCQDEVLMRYRIHGGSISTSNFRMTRMKYEWVRVCMRARRQGQPEPLWEDFLTQWKQSPLLKRLHHWRKTDAKFYYRKAAHECIDGQYLTGIPALGMAFLLQPGYTLKRLKHQIFK